MADNPGNQPNKAPDSTPAPGADPKPVAAPTAAPKTADPGAAPAPEPKRTDSSSALSRDDSSAPAPTGQPGPKDFPADWREKMATGADGKVDDKILQRLQRYQNPAAVTQALVAAQTRISAGDTDAKPPENATAEEMAAWRKDHGIPGTPEDYLTHMPKELVESVEDKRYIGPLMALAHERNLSPDVATELAYAYDEIAGLVEEDLANRDTQQETECTDTLRNDWGNQDFRRNKNTVLSFLQSAPEGLGDLIMNGRLSDGRKIGNSPAAIQWLLELSNQINPIRTVVPGGDANMRSLQDRKAEIEKVMRENRKAYNKDPKMQEEYQRLIDAELEVKRRGVP